MSIGYFAEWLDVIYKIGITVFGIWLYLDRRNDNTHVRIAKLDDKLDDKLGEHADRLAKIETKLAVHPTHDHLGEVYKEIRKLSDSQGLIASALAAIKEGLETVKRQTNRMETIWLEHK